MNKINKLLLLFIFLLNFKSYAQTPTTEEILQDRYWAYREKFRKHFVYLEENPGGGYPFSDIASTGMSNWEVDASGNIISGAPEVGNNGRLTVGGDVTAYMGDYMGILASEYFLLKSYKKDVSSEMLAVRNEIYYALYAIERLDKFSPRFYNPGVNSDANPDGFFVRDDAPLELAEDMDVFYSPKIRTMSSNNSQGRPLVSTLTNRTNGIFVSQLIESTSPTYFRYKNTNGDHIGRFYDLENNPQRNLNAMSQDQLIGILFGFKCIVKFLEDGTKADPDGISGSLPEKDLKDWVRVLTHKFMVHLTKTTYDIKMHDDESLEDRWLKKCQKHYCGGRKNSCDKCDYGRYKIYSYLEPHTVNLAAHSRYVITNPNTDGRPVFRGSYAFGFGYPLEKLGEDITGNDYPGVTMTLSFGMQAARIGLDAIAVLATVGAMKLASNLPIEKLGLPADPITKSVFKVGLFDATMHASPDYLSLRYLGRPFQPHESVWWRDLYNFIPRKELVRKQLKNSTAAAMFIWLPSASQTWEKNEFEDLMDVYGTIQAKLFWCVLNNQNKPDISSSVVETQLLNSDCEGITNAIDEWSNAPYNRLNIFSKISNHGYTGDDGNYKSHGTNRDQLEYYNGMDWMLVYNFYRIIDYKNLKDYEEKVKIGQNDPNTLWKNLDAAYTENFLRLPIYEPVYCPCKSSYEFYSDRDVPSNTWLHNNGSHITSLPFTPSISGHKTIGDLKIRVNKYKDLGINITDWLTQDFTINSGGLLKPLGDLTICNSHVVVNSGGTLSTDENTDAEYPKFIKVSKNSSIEIYDGGVLNIENNTSVVIEKGAKLIFHPGAQIVLNGSNAQLFFNQSQLEIKSGATFNVTEGTDGRGYVHFHNDWLTSNDPASIVCQDNTARFHLEGQHTDKGSYYNDKILEVTGNIGIVTDWKLKEFAVEKGFVSMGKNSGINSNAEFTYFNKCVVNVLSNATQDLYNKHNGIQIPGRLNYFNEVDINNCNKGIRYFNRGAQGVLKLDNVLIHNAITAIDQFGGGFLINNSQFGAIENAINVNGGTGNSKLRKSTLAIDIPAGFRSGSNSLRYSSTGNLYAWKNWVKNASNGFSVIHSRARFKCNVMNENFTNLRWVFASYINLNEGYNQFANLSSNHLLGRGQTYFYLKDGYNVFENSTNSMGAKVFNVIASNSSPNNLFQLDGGNNGYVGVNLIHSPPTSRNYNLQLISSLNGALPYDVDLITSPNLSSTIYTTRDNNCTDENEFPVFFYKGNGYGETTTSVGEIGTMKLYSRPYPDLKVVKISSTTNNALDNVIRDNFERLNNPTVIGLNSLITELSNVFKLNAHRPDLKDTASIGNVKIAYEFYNLAINYLAFRETSDSSENNYSKTSGIYSNVDSTFQSLWVQSKDTSSVWSLNKFQIVTDWAQLNRLANNRVKAIAILDSGLLELEDTLALQGLNNWKCVNQIEILLQSDSSLSLDSAKASCNCFDESEIEVDNSIVQKDTSIHYCDWNVEGIKETNGALWIDTGELMSIDNLNDVNDVVETNTSGIYQLLKGDYKFTYFDTLTYTPQILNIHVIADTIEKIVNDTTFHICDNSELGGSNKITLSNFHSLPNKVFNNEGNLHPSDVFSEGTYKMESFDTNNCRVYIDNITVEIDTLLITSLGDTAITMCSMKNISSEFIDSINIYNLPYRVKVKAGYQDSLTLEDSLSSTMVNVDFIDSLNCQIYRKTVEINYFIPLYTKSDTTIIHCSEDSAYFLDVESIPIVASYDHYVVQVYPDTAVVYGDSFIMSGKYLIYLYDYDNNTVKELALTFIDSLICDTIPGPILNLEEANRRYKIELFPNPAENILNIQTNLNQQITNVRIFSLIGEEIYSNGFDTNENNQEVQLDVSELKNGYYIIEIKTDYGVYQRKILISK